MRPIHSGARLIAPEWKSTAAPTPKNAPYDTLPESLSYRYSCFGEPKQTAIRRGVCRSDAASYASICVAMDLILTGRAVGAEEALSIGLANRVVPTGRARDKAEELAAELADLPQQCLRADRLSVLHQWGRPEAEAMDFEFGSMSRVAAESLEGASRFAAGAGRHGAKA